MKTKFKFKYFTTFYVLFVVIYALALTALIWNGIRLYNAATQAIELGAYRTVSLIVSLVLPIVISVFITAAIINSAYTVDETSLTVNFGLLKEKYALSEVTQIIKNVRYSTLHVVFKDGASYRIVIDAKEFDDFSSLLVKRCGNAVYGETDEEIKK